MSRIVFDEVAVLLRWATDNCDAVKYQLYITSYSEVVLVPTRTSRNLRYGYIDAMFIGKKVDEVAKQVQEVIPGIKVYKVRKFDWDEDRSPMVAQEP